MDIPFANELLYRAVVRRSSRAPVAALAALSLPEIRRVLLVLTTGLGDAILSTPVFPNLRRALPQADIRLFCRAPWTGLFERDPDLNGVIPYFGKYRRFFSTIRALRSVAPELTVVLHGNDPDILPLAYLAGSRFIVRIPTSGTRYRFLLSNQERAQDADTAPHLHYIENRLRVLDTIGVAVTERTPRVVLAPEAVALFRERIADSLRGRRYWVYHAFAADMYKVWPIAKARDLLVKTLAANDDAVVLTGSGREREAVTALATGLPTARAINLCGQLSILETAACLRLARCVVAPDTGVLHLAAALDVPAIGLYAATLPSQVGPRPHGAPVVLIRKPQTCDPCLAKQCPYLPRNCMDQIATDEVFNTLVQALAGARV